MGITKLHALPGKQVERILADVLEIAAVSRALALEYFQADLIIEQKSDGSFVTQADVAIEHALRSEISRRYPNHGIVGEELASINPESEFQWTLDPIDGTENFCRRIATFGTLIGVRFCGEEIAGVIDHPALGICLSAARGHGVMLNAKPLQPLWTEPLRSAPMLAIGNPKNFSSTGDTDVLLRLLNVCPNARIYADCFAHSVAVRGQVDMLVSYNLKPWDLAGLQVLMEESGGVFRVLRRIEQPGGAPLISIVAGSPEGIARLDCALGY